MTNSTPPSSKPDTRPGPLGNPFPKGFIWGAASAAYQIEGSVDAGGRSSSVWDEFCDKPGAVARGQSGRHSCRHYDLYPQDVDLLADLGATAYRMSIAWPRIIPGGTGAPSAEGLAFYDRLIDALLERGVQPWCTLYHWDMPESIFRRGGWLNRECADWFADYAAVVADRFSDRVTNWMTLNEPQVYIHHGHVEGIHAPGMRYDTPQVIAVAHHSLLAHGRAVQVLRSFSRTEPTIGWAPVGETRIPATTSDADIEAARADMFAVQDRHGWIFNNTWFSDPAVLGRYPEDGLAIYGKHLPKTLDADLATIAQPLDFYGVNIYQAPTVRATSDGLEQVPIADGTPRTRFGWPVTPEALYWGPRFIHERYKLPIYITENGLASMDWVHADGAVRDPGRIDFLTRYLSALRRASDDGTDVRGYFHWSILDNFEWAEGYDMRFGLVYVDYATGERIPKDSYRWYQSVIKQNGTNIPADLCPLR